MHVSDARLRRNVYKRAQRDHQLASNLLARCVMSSIQNPNNTAWLITRQITKNILLAGFDSAPRHVSERPSICANDDSGTSDQCFAQLFVREQAALANARKIISTSAFTPPWHAFSLSKQMPLVDLSIPAAARPIICQRCGCLITRSGFPTTQGL